MKTLIIQSQLIGMLLLSIPLYSQNINKVSQKAEEAFKQRVKVLDEFYRRFNYEIGPDGELPTDNTGSYRIELILSLFDNELVQKNQLDSSMIKEFVLQVTRPENPIKLAYHDKGWFSSSEWSATLDGNDVDLTIYLITETEPNRSKWSITAVDAPFLDKTKLTGKNFSPIDHDLDFMNLKKGLKPGNCSLNMYASSSFTDQPLVKFFTLIENGRLKLLQAPRPQYIFTQVPGWYFEVHYFERTGPNSGWRIASLKKMTENEKGKYSAYLGIPAPILNN